MESALCSQGGSERRKADMPPCRDSLHSLLEGYQLKKSDFEKDDLFHLEKIFRDNQKFADAIIKKSFVGSEGRIQAVVQISSRIKSYFCSDPQGGASGQVKSNENHGCNHSENHGQRRWGEGKSDRDSRNGSHDHESSRKRPRPDDVSTRRREGEQEGQRAQPDRPLNRFHHESSSQDGWWRFERAKNDLVGSAHREQHVAGCHRPDDRRYPDRDDSWRHSQQHKNTGRCIVNRGSSAERYSRELGVEERNYERSCSFLSDGRRHDQHAKMPRDRELDGREHAERRRSEGRDGQRHGERYTERERGREHVRGHSRSYGDIHRYGHHHHRSGSREGFHDRDDRYSHGYEEVSRYRRDRVRNEERHADHGNRDEHRGNNRHHHNQHQYPQTSLHHHHHHHHHQQQQQHHHHHHHQQPQQQQPQPQQPQLRNHHHHHQQHVHHSDTGVKRAGDIPGGIPDDRPHPSERPFPAERSSCMIQTDCASCPPTATKEDGSMQLAKGRERDCAGGSDQPEPSEGGGKDPRQKLFVAEPPNLSTERTAVTTTLSDVKRVGSVRSSSQSDRATGAASSLPGSIPRRARLFSKTVTHEVENVSAVNNEDGRAEIGTPDHGKTPESSILARSEEDGAGQCSSTGGQEEPGQDATDDVIFLRVETCQGQDAAPAPCAPGESRTQRRMEELTKDSWTASGNPVGSATGGGRRTSDLPAHDASKKRVEETSHVQQELREPRAVEGVRCVGHAGREEDERSRARKEDGCAKVQDGGEKDKRGGEEKGEGKEKKELKGEKKGRNTSKEQKDGETEHRKEKDVFKHKEDGKQRGMEKEAENEKDKVRKKDIEKERKRDKQEGKQKEHEKEKVRGKKNENEKKEEKEKKEEGKGKEKQGADHRENGKGKNKGKGKGKWTATVQEEKRGGKIDEEKEKEEDKARKESRERKNPKKVQKNGNKQERSEKWAKEEGKQRKSAQLEKEEEAEKVARVPAKRRAQGEEEVEEERRDGVPACSRRKSKKSSSSTLAVKSATGGGGAGNKAIYESSGDDLPLWEVKKTDRQDAAAAAAAAAVPPPLSPPPPPASKDAGKVETKRMKKEKKMEQVEPAATFRPSKKRKSNKDSCPQEQEAAGCLPEVRLPGDPLNALPLVGQGRGRRSREALEDRGQSFRHIDIKVGNEVSARREDGSFQHGVVACFEGNGDLRLQWAEPCSLPPFSVVRPADVRYPKGSEVDVKGEDGRRLQALVLDVFKDGSYHIFFVQQAQERKVPCSLVMRRRLVKKQAGEEERRKRPGHAEDGGASEEGCQRAMGYRPIPWETKVKYLQFNHPLSRSKEPVKVQEEEMYQVHGKQGSSWERANRRATRKQATVTSSISSDAFRFDQLKSRVKRLSFRKSAIHGWGLYADEVIEPEEMVIEYKGELISNKVCEKREKMYERSGMGSSYMFRVSKSQVIDATHCGSRARYINHSCEPNCYTRIIHVGGKPKVVLYSRRTITEGEELCYDYNFPPEDGCVPCHCGADRCRGYMA